LPPLYCLAGTRMMLPVRRGVLLLAFLDTCDSRLFNAFQYPSALTVAVPCLNAVVDGSRSYRAASS
jgi:hypothetical protein